MSQRRTATPALRAVIAALGLLILAATPASGHASGQLPHARLSAEGRTLTVVWSAAPDDVVDVGVAIGLLPETAMLAYLGGPIADLPTEAELEAFATSPQLRDYLLEHIGVRQAGQDCDGEVISTSDPLDRGVELRFTCPQQVEQVDLRITMLHDRDPAYRTFSVDGTIRSAVHTATAPEQPWDLTPLAGDWAGDQTEDQAGERPGREVWLAGAAAVGLGLGAGVWLLRRDPQQVSRSRGG